MHSIAEELLGAGTPVDKQTVRLVRSLGPESVHVPSITDPAAARVDRIESRREWPDSAASDVPDRFPLFELMGEVDMVAWPELGTAVDEAGRVAAHLREPGAWVLVGESTVGEVVIEMLPSGGHIARAVTANFTSHGFGFSGPTEFLAAVARARAEIDWLDTQARAPQDRGG